MGIYTIPDSIIVDLIALRKTVIGDGTGDTVGFYGITPAVIPDADNVTDIDSLVDELQTIGIISATS